MRGYRVVRSSDSETAMATRPATTAGANDLSKRASGLADQRDLVAETLRDSLPLEPFDLLLDLRPGAPQDHGDEVQGKLAVVVLEDLEEDRARAAGGAGGSVRFP